MAFGFGAAGEAGGGGSIARDLLAVGWPAAGLPVAGWPATGGLVRIGETGGGGG